MRPAGAGAWCSEALAWRDDADEFGGADEVGAVAPRRAWQEREANGVPAVRLDGALDNPPRR